MKYSASRWLSRVMQVAVIVLCPQVLAQEQPAVEPGEYFSAMPTTYPDWFKTSFFDLLEDVDEAALLDKKLLVLFSQDNCPYCHALINQVYADPVIEAYLREHFDVIHINMWGDIDVTTVDGEILTEEQFARALNVQFTPTTLILDNSGQPIRRINGYRDKQAYLLPLRYATESYDTGTSFEDFRSRKGAEGRGIPEIMLAYLVDEPEIVIEAHTAIMLVDDHCRECDSVAELMRNPVIAGQLEILNLKVVDIGANPELVSVAKRVPVNTVLGDSALAHAPTILFFDPGAEEVIRIDAFFKSFHFNGILDYVIHEDYLEEPSFQRYLSARADEIRESGIDVNIWE